MIENNAFCNSEPQEDALCGCVENYDLTDWNDTPPQEWEGGEPEGCSCVCDGENGDAYDNMDPDGCHGCCKETGDIPCGPCEDAVRQTETADSAAYHYELSQGSYEDQIIEI